MTLQRMFASVLTDWLQDSRDFYVELFGFTVSFDSNWFVQLSAPSETGLELGLLVRNHETVPASFRTTPVGGLITLVVDDVDAVHAAATARGAKIVEPPRDMFYGMRRMLLADPNGQLLDVSSVIRDERRP